MNDKNMVRARYKGFFRRRRFQVIGILALMAVLSILASAATEFSLVQAFTAIPRVLTWMFTNFIPDARALGRIPNILDKLLDTVFISIMASVSAAVFSFFFAIMGSRTTRVNDKVALIPMTIASFFRNIPVAAWAMILLFSFGANDFTGFMALFFATFGFLTRVFMDTIDEVSASAVEALRASGATYSQVIANAVVPGALPQMISWVLFMIETNIRSAALVGLLTGTGIGFTFDLYFKNLQYPSAALVVIGIVLVVLGIEALSNYLRRIIL